MHDVEAYDDWQYRAPTVHTAKFKRKPSALVARARRRNRRILLTFYTLAVCVGYLLFLAWVNR